MMKDTFVYLSGPITAKDGFSVEENVAAALKVYLDCLALGVPAFCPQLAAGFASSFDVAYETWIDYSFAVIDRSTHVLMLPRWETSSGAVREREYAIERGMPVLSSLDELR